MLRFERIRFHGRFRDRVLEEIPHRPLFRARQAAIGFGDSHGRAVDVDEGFVVADGPFRKSGGDAVG